MFNDYYRFFLFFISIWVGLGYLFDVGILIFLFKVLKFFIVLFLLVGSCCNCLFTIFIGYVNLEGYINELFGFCIDFFLNLLYRGKFRFLGLLGFSIFINDFFCLLVYWY